MWWNGPIFSSLFFNGISFMGSKIKYLILLKTLCYNVVCSISNGFKNNCSMLKFLANGTYHDILMVRTYASFCALAQKLQRSYHYPPCIRHLWSPCYSYPTSFIIAYILNSYFVTVWLQMNCTVTDNTRKIARR